MNVAKYLLCVMLIGYSSIGLSQEDMDQSKDYALVTGITMGVLTVPGRDQPVALGGLPLAWRMIIGHNPVLDSTYQLGTLLDFGNSQIAKYNGEVGLTWHVLGGARYIKRVSPLGTIIGSSPYNLSIPLKVSYNQFSISSKDDYLDRVTGSTLDFKTGLLYRLELFDEMAFSIEFLVSFLSFPASVERLQHTGIDLNIVWRTDF